MPLFIQVDDEPRHYERLAGPGRHIEKKMQRIFLAVKLITIAMEKPPKRLPLVLAQCKRRI